MNQKGLAPILVVVLVTALVGGYFIFTNYSNNRIKTASISQFQPNPSASPSPTPVPSPKITKDPNTGWNIYSDPNLNYTISFPPGYTIYNEGADSMAFMSPLNRPEHGAGSTGRLIDGELKVEIFTYCCPREFIGTLEDLYKSLQQDIANNPKVMTKKVTLNGTEAVHMIGDGQSNDSESYSMVRNNKRIIIQKFPLKTSRQNEFEQMISTFKFTK